MLARRAKGASPTSQAIGQGSPAFDIMMITCTAMHQPFRYTYLVMV